MSEDEFIPGERDTVLLASFTHLLKLSETVLGCGSLYEAVVDDFDEVQSLEDAVRGSNEGVACGTQALWPSTHDEEALWQQEGGVLLRSLAHLKLKVTIFEIGYKEPATGGFDCSDDVSR